MKIIGLTGPTGSGKSTACKAAEGQGFFIIDCDKVARECTEKGSPLLGVLVEAFGDDIIATSGELDRKALAKMAFSNKESTQLLNSIMLPFIANRITEQLELLKADGVSGVILDAPTLYESGLDEICHGVVAVLCDKVVRRKRIIERDGLTEEQADTRLSASKPDSFYTERTDRVVFSDGNVEKLKQDFLTVLGSI